MRHSALALGEERRKEVDNVSHETGEAFKLRVRVSCDNGRQKSKGDTNEPGDVGGVVDTVKLDHMFSSGRS